MKIHRFFVQTAIGDSKEVVLADASLAHQLKNVFRFKTGDQVILLDNSGSEFVSEIVSLSKSEVKFHVVEKRQNASTPSREVWLYQSLIKKDNFEWILEKGTELGVAHFVPVLSDRNEKKDLNVERAHKILKEASEQSGRGTLPVLHEVTNLEKAIDDAKNTGVSLVVFHTEAAATGAAHKKETIPAFLAKSAASVDTKQTKYGILIGPEGGWTPLEIDLFKVHEITILNLGTQVLRAETAAIAVATLFLLD